jgi:DNA-binding NarL/FixJ family response regulator
MLDQPIYANKSNQNFEMQQNPKTNSTSDESNSHTPESPSDAPDPESEADPLLEEYQADEVVEAYRAQHPPEKAYALSDSPDNGRESIHEEYRSTDNEYINEDDSEERESAYEADDDDTLPISVAHKRVLLIEDDDDTTEILKQNLQTLGITKVNVATNAEGALSLLATDREMFPDVVVLELALIGMDGIQFLAQLRAHKSKRLQNLPAVVITMLDSPSIFRRAARQKVGAFLRKPVSTEGLKKGIEAALRGDVVEQPFSQPKSWLDHVDEQELKEKRESIKAKAAAKAEKKGFWVWLLNTLVPWSGRI